MKDATSYKINWCGIKDCDPNWSWLDNRGFRDYDLYVVFRGVGSIELNGEKYDIKEGSCLLIPPKTRIRAAHDIRFPLLTANVHFDFTENDLPIYPYGVEDKNIGNIAFFRDIFDRLISSFYSKKKEDALLWLSALLSEFFASEKIQENSVISNAHVRLVQDICKKINGNIPASTSLSAFAEEHGYSTTYLGKIFHKVTGVTFSQYLLNARINQAKLLLRTTDLSINAISEQLGYYDTSHFIRQFKQIVGRSPKVYK